MKSVTQFENKKVLVLGLAKSGEAAARLLAKLGAIVTVNDGKPFEENPSAQALLEEVKNPKIKGIVSVTSVHVTEDLKFADVFFSIMGQENINTDEVLEGLNQIKGFLRKRVAEEIEIRYIPEIRVKIDDSIEHAVKISKLLNDLKR